MWMSQGAREWQWSTGFVYLGEIAQYESAANWDSNQTVAKIEIGDRFIALQSSESRPRNETDPKKKSGGVYTRRHAYTQR